MPYQIWDKTKLGQRSGTPSATHYTLDEAMKTALSLSKGTQTKQIWDSKKKNSQPTGWWGGGNGAYTDVEVPNSFAVIQITDGPSVIRGYAVSGKWHDYKAVCKRCNSTGNEPNSPQELCNSCQGSSFKPKV